MFYNIEKCTNPYIMKDGRIFTCGQCQLCKRKKSQEWTARVIHEINTTPGKKAVFLTLTYNKKNLRLCNKELFIPQAEGDKGGNLDKEDMKNFLKRLRKKLDKHEIKIKYLYCGEYGGLRKRPHYHALLIGVTAQDLQKLAIDVEKIWGLGYVDVDTKPITEKAIKYVLGYVRKKIGNVNEKYDEIGRIKPYQRQSQGMGYTWAVKNAKMWTTTGSITVDNYQQSIPRYYKNKIYEQEGIKIRYSNTTTYVIDNGVIGTAVNKNNYKIIRNEDGIFTKEIRAKQLEGELKNIDSYSTVYNGIDIPFYRNKAIQTYNDGTREHNSLYTSYLGYGRSYMEQFLSKHRFSETTSEEIEMKKIPRNRRQPNIQWIERETQEKMRGVALNKEAEMLKSPFGKRDRIDAYDTE